MQVQREDGLAIKRNQVLEQNTAFIGDSKSLRTAISSAQLARNGEAHD